MGLGRIEWPVDRIYSCATRHAHRQGEADDAGDAQADGVRPKGQGRVRLAARGLSCGDEEEGVVVWCDVRARVPPLITHEHVPTG